MELLLSRDLQSPLELEVKHEDQKERKGGNHHSVFF